MIDLDKLNYVLFDFDDTLCIHTRKKLLSYDSTDYMKSLLLNDSWWDKIGCKPNKYMKEFMIELQNRNIELGLISQTDSYIHMVRKQEWVKEKYDIDLKNYCVSSDKIDMMVALSRAYPIPFYSILIVDDKETILNMAVSKGFQAASPIEVVNYIADKKIIYRKES